MKEQEGKTVEYIQKYLYDELEADNGELLKRIRQTEKENEKLYKLLYMHGADPVEVSTSGRVVDFVYRNWDTYFSKLDKPLWYILHDVTLLLAEHKSLKKLQTWINKALKNRDNGTGQQTTDN